MKTAELTGAALDWAVAKCLPDDTVRVYFDEDTGEKLSLDDWEVPEFSPSINWAQGGAIIERELIELGLFADRWRAVMHLDDGGIYQDGTTPLIAAMRCYVSSKLGDEVELPEELEVTA